jgi:hypothetical protein
VTLPSRCGRSRAKKITLDFQGGSISSKSCVLLLSETEARVSIVSTWPKRVYQVACGFDNTNDSDTLFQF